MQALNNMLLLARASESSNSGFSHLVALSPIFSIFPIVCNLNNNWYGANNSHYNIILKQSLKMFVNLVENLAFLDH